MSFASPSRRMSTHQSVNVTGGMNAPTGKPSGLRGLCNRWGCFDATPIDPTGTTSIRRRYESDMGQRFTKMRVAMRHALVDLDVLGLKAKSIHQRMQSGLLFQLETTDDNLMSREFMFADPHDRIASVNDWFYKLSRQTIMDDQFGEPSRVAAQFNNWQSQYIRKAYDKGSRDAERKASHFMDAPRRRGERIGAERRVAILQQRSYTELEGITEEMSRRIARELANGVAAGKHPIQIARAISKAIGISINRARVIARTETISAHAEATLDKFEEMNIRGVSIEAEFSTAGDKQVCPVCRDLEGETYSISDARGIIPVHPNCRCSWLPST